MSGSRVNLEIETPAPRGGIGDPGPLVRQEQAVMEGQASLPAVLDTTGETRPLPAQDAAVLEGTVSGEAVA